MAWATIAVEDCNGKGGFQINKHVSFLEGLIDYAAEGDIIKSIDPYADTTFNADQCFRLVQEVKALKQKPGFQSLYTEVADFLIEYAEFCIKDRSLYLNFWGD